MALLLMFAFLVATGALMAVACDADDPTATSTRPAPDSPAAHPTVSLRGVELLAGHVIVDDAPVSAGDVALDALIASLEDQDIDAIMDLIAVEPCSLVQNPRCDFGMAEGTLVPSQFFTFCGGYTLATRMEQARAVLSEAFEHSERSTVYAATQRTSGQKGDYELRTRIILVAGDRPSPFAPASIWWTTAEGKIAWPEIGCGPPDAVDQVTGFGSLGEHGVLIRPRAQCEAGETRVAMDVLPFEYLPGSDDGITGSELDADGAPTGITLRIDTTGWITNPRRDRHTPAAGIVSWSGGPLGYSDLAPGMRLLITGWRHDTCLIEPRTITLVP
ncbi:MAG: hypothetical protein WEC75_11555 [Dehalococcoidia bacterium]